jgi:hypothetical protein
MLGRVAAVGRPRAVEIAAVAVLVDPVAADLIFREDGTLTGAPLAELDPLAALEPHGARAHRLAPIGVARLLRAYLASAALVDPTVRVFVQAVVAHGFASGLRGPGNASVQGPIRIWRRLVRRGVADDFRRGVSGGRSPFGSRFTEIRRGASDRAVA